jgi:hypothetical protein
MLCGSGTTGCHGWVEENPDTAGEFGWHVRPWQQPCDIYVFYQRTAWALLTDNGEIEWKLNSTN